MKTVVFVEGLALSCYVGVPDEERNTPQTVLIDIACTARSPRVEGDEIDATVDYAPIVRKVRALGVSTRKRKLIETLAEEIAAICFEDSRVAIAEVTIRKPRKLPDCDAVGVRRTFERS